MFRYLLMLVVVCFIGCASPNDAPPTSIYDDWVYLDSNSTTGIGLNLSADGTYVFTVLQLTSDNSAQAVVESGTFSSTSDTLSFVPTQSTCPTSEFETLKYQLRYSALELMFSQGIISLQKNTGSSVSNFILTFGCFQGGKFTAASLHAVN